MNSTKKLLILFLGLITPSLFSLSSFGDMEFDEDLVAFKTLTLDSFPEISIPIYKSSGRRGPGILFIHGNSSSSRAFHRQIFSEFGRTYKLFFLDLPGNGRASKVDADRTMPMLSKSSPAGFGEYQTGLVEAVSQVANDNDVQAKVLVGWSLGGDVAIMTKGLGMVPNVKAVMIMGTAPANIDSPLNEAPFNLVNKAERLMGLSTYAGFGLSFNFRFLNPYKFDGKFSDSIPIYAPRSAKKFKTRGSAYFNAFFNPMSDFRVPSFVIADGLSRSDDRFRASLGVMALGRAADLDVPNELDVIRNFEHDGTVLAVVMGEHDVFVNRTYLSELKDKKFLPTLWKDKIQIIENAGHAAQLEQSQAFNSLVEKFVNDID